MWWRKRKYNRRTKHDQVLDVKIRSDKVRAERLRSVATALSVAALAFVMILLLWRGGDWLLRVLFYENPDFAIEHVEIQTDGIIPLEQLQKWAGVKAGDNLLELDLLQLKRHLQLVPLIEEASVERVVPHTLRITVTEREPIAQAYTLRPAKLGGYELATYYLDAKGFVMLPFQRDMAALSPGDSLPILTGLNSFDLRPGYRAETPGVQASLALIGSFENSPMYGLADLARIDLSNPDTLLITTSQGTEITFGLKHLELQVKRWRMVYDHGTSCGKAISRLDLAVSNNSPVAWVEANALPPSKPKAVKTSRYKKKNV